MFAIDHHPQCHKSASRGMHGTRSRGAARSTISARCSVLRTGRARTIAPAIFRALLSSPSWWSQSAIVFSALWFSRSAAVMPWFDPGAYPEALLPEMKIRVPDPSAETGSPPDPQSMPSRSACDPVPKTPHAETRFGPQYSAVFVRAISSDCAIPIVRDHRSRPPSASRRSPSYARPSPAVQSR